MSGYDLRLDVRCYCPHSGHYLLRVRPGKPHELVPIEHGRPVAEDSLAVVRGYDVEGLFREIEEAIDHNYDAVDVIYDHGYGYPIALQLDGNAQMFDDELQVLAMLTTYPAESPR